MSTEICPRCGESVNTTQNRLITENCGHIKCRNCLINEINGCTECQLQFVNLVPVTFNPPEGSLLDTDSNNSNLLIASNREETTSLESFAVIIPHYVEPQQPLQECGQTAIQILQEIIIPPQNVAAAFYSAPETVEEAPVKPSKRKSLPSHIVQLVEGGKTNYKCNICDKTFASRNQQYYHIYCANPSMKPFKCSVCKKGFASSSHLQYHTESHKTNERFNCPDCSKTFRRRITLKNHARIHKKAYNFQCGECGKKFFDKISFNAHTNKHKNIFPHECDICQRKFSFKTNLVKHKLIHEGKKNFRCDKCGKCFIRRSSLKEHIQRHLDIKNFSCSSCKKEFINQKSLDRHKVVHSESKLYTCPHCTIKSSRKDNLIRHIRNMHPEKDLQVSIKTLSKIPESLKSSTTKTIAEKDPFDIFVPPKEPETTKLPKAREDDDISSRIIITSSVIRSIGNVRPVTVPTDCSTPIADSLQADKFTETSVNEKISKKEAEPVKENETNSKNQAGTPNNKPIKKKYDPCEIYRKILFASNDDDDDSILNGDNQNSDSRDQHIDCCNEEPKEIEKTLKPEIVVPSNFAEMHWRKRTSQHFFAAI